MALWRNTETLPYQMFDLAKLAYEAKKATVLENVYHKAQERAWSGREILPVMVEKHGPPTLPQREKEALARIFAIILWGELAAWKISAQLADEIVPLEAKMAATSQAFDEARHFYTMYDYLMALGYVPERIDRLSERVLDHTLRAKKLSHKICGMQLMIETIALTIFQTVRKSGIEPVLCEILRYYEVDEARHVALGVNYLPAMIKQMSRLELAEFMLFQARLMFWVVHSLKALKPDLAVLGIDPRAIVELGKAKQYEVFREVWADLGIDIKEARSPIARIVEAIDELYFPRDESTSTFERLKRAAAVFRARYSDVDPNAQAEAHDQLHADTILPGMGATGQPAAPQKRPARSRH